MTLVEVMIAIGILSMIMVGLLGVYLTCTHLCSGSMGQLNIQSQARSGIDTIMDDLRRGSTAEIFVTYSSTPTLSPSGQGQYFRVLCPTNSVPSSNEIYRHFYIGNIKTLDNGLTNATLFYYTSGTASEAPLSSQGEPREIVSGITNPEMIFQQVGGAFVINIRLIDPNDQDGKQVIFLRSTIALRNPGLF